MYVVLCISPTHCTGFLVEPTLPIGIQPLIIKKYILHQHISLPKVYSRRNGNAVRVIFLNMKTNIDKRRVSCQRLGDVDISMIQMR